jgi:predicted ribosome quality control (RQC) complex YloA/Tae2 family protein
VTSGGSDIVEYALPGGWEVLAGRTDAANDHLSLKLARPGDLWFHIRGMPGSHVVLRVRTDAAPDRATQELAASIAAFHSKARGAGTVAVSCTDARNVSKPRGTPPGTVTIKKETVLKVRPLTEAAAATYRVKPLPSGHRADDE